MAGCRREEGWVELVHVHNRRHRLPRLAALLQRAAPQPPHSLLWGLTTPCWRCAPIIHGDIEQIR